MKKVMLIVKASSSHIVIEASPFPLWLAAGAGILGVVFGISALWLMPNFSRQEAVTGTAVLSVLILIFSPLLFFYPTVTTIFDKNSGWATMEQKWFWKKETAKYPLRKIRTILVVKKDRIPFGSPYFKIVVEFYSGQQVPLSPLDYHSKTTIEKQAHKIRRFLEA